MAKQKGDEEMTKEIIEVEVWYYAKSENRVVRFSKKVMLSAAPFTGSYISLKHDNLKIGSVTFNDGGGIIVVVDNEDEENHDVRSDPDLVDMINEMKDQGWIVLSNVKRRKGRGFVSGRSVKGV
jgi:predicted small secreted protein